MVVATECLWGSFSILGIFPNATAGVHIVNGPVMRIADGGCGVANVWFDADTLKLIQATWGGR